MPGSSFGKIFRLHSFGESHGPAFGGIIDGCPAGVEMDLKQIQKELDRRKPGQSQVTTGRKESDQVEFLSGFFEGKTLGTPIGFIIRNEDSKSKDYDDLKEVYRPGHADYTYEQKYGIRDHRGGGRSSARETACRVVAGAIAKQILQQKGIQVLAWVQRLHDISVSEDYSKLSLNRIDSNSMRCPDDSVAKEMEDLVIRTKESGDSLGGSISCIIQGVPSGLGEPVFDKLNAALGQAMLSINAVKSFEIGSGIKGTFSKGSENNDPLEIVDGKTKFKTNNAGGILGGISNGDDIVLHIGFKPVSTINKAQSTTNKEGKNINLEAKGRHDPTVLPRAVPIVESMAAITILDYLLLANVSRLEGLNLD